MGDGVPCYGALEIVGLLLYYYYIYTYIHTYIQAYIAVHQTSLSVKPIRKSDNFKQT